MMSNSNDFGGEPIPHIPNFYEGAIREEGKLTELYVALAKARLEFDEVVFDSTNPHFKSKYVTLGAIQRATVPALAKNGLIIMQLPIVKSDGTSLVVTKLLHTSGAKIEFDFWIEPKDRSPHAFGSAITYTKRYCQMALLNIFGDEDDDGNLASNSKPKAQIKSSKNKNANNDLQTQADAMASGIDDKLAMVESQSDLQKLVKELNQWRTDFAETQDANKRLDGWRSLVNGLKEQYA